MVDRYLRIKRNRITNVGIRVQLIGFQRRCCALLLLAWLPLAAMGADNGDSIIALYPRAQLVESASEQGVSTHRVMLGALKKVNSEIAPEASRYVQGERTRNTYLLPDEPRSNLVFDFYLEQLERQGQILYQCAGRECGSSNYWANSVFERRILYGPEQYQHYVVGVVDGQYLAIYVAQRATGQVYAHLDTIKPQRDSAAAANALDSANLLQALTSGAAVKIGLRPDVAATNKVVAALMDNPALSLYVVGHDALQRDETVLAAMTRTAAAAGEFRLRLIKLGIAESRLQAYGVGPLAPSIDAPARLELLLAD